ncbi:hypothetical protein LTR78_007024 [Recurvomyces mirabilis]|uniref:Uncharacterized protein n=1 Tax=Recurvomyces mirabilis TaxID=574656 RepID=A0AAE0WK39_9PEZI|nr:hypothetical protein LTR78_007024 [Recurvomyces mirabilis]KAK5153408.1 hypothetical protein LTS14_007577 [Recurvomyces mirabilis]
MDEAGKVALEYTKALYRHALKHVRDHISKNPGITSFQLIMILLACVPVLVAAPGLAAIGLGALGPSAGGAAAGYQAVHGTTAAFSLLQSAAMGGYGAAVVNGAVTGVTAVSGVVAGFLTRR